MRKSLLFVAFVTLALTATAQNIRSAKAHVRTGEKLHKARAAVQARVPGVDAVLETPAGKLREGLTMACLGDYPRGWDIYERNVTGKVTAIVEGDDGCVYLQNPVPVCSAVKGAWLKLERGEKDTLVARLPQSATAEIEYEGETYRLNFDRLAFDEDEGYYFPSFGESELKFVYRDGVLRSVNEIDTDNTDGEMMYMLGITDDSITPDNAEEAWFWYGVADIVVGPQPDAVLTLPEGLTAQNKVMTSAAGQQAVSVAVDGSTVYLNTGDSKGYIKGTVSDGKATFESGQYIGIVGDDHCYFFGGLTETVEDEDYGTYDRVIKTDALVFDYQTPDALLASDGVIVINQGNGSLYYTNIYQAPVIADYESVEGTPQNPTIVRYTEYDDFDEYGVLTFDLPALTTDGRQISHLDLCYNIYVEGSDRPYVFTTDVYDLLQADMTDVPYDYTNNYDIEVSGERHTIVIYSDLGRMGIQQINRAGGKESRSAIVWTDGTVTTGIREVAGAAVADSRTYDLSGRLTDGTARGLYIRSVTRPDGTVRMVKMVRK